MHVFLKRSRQRRQPALARVLPAGRDSTRLPGSHPAAAQFDRIDLGGFGDSIADSSEIISPAQWISSP
jgi:hypothetical protein